ncbi:hypothetical protein PGTUg99_014223 [Puccinia graminis f. sp. tritici]|uniref:Uncharacterized protein n=1 Tax=Puccinia graminis f. sp. tritici TaxID=56615 RepID=A0A5B0S4P7_PUCGR|nr:hypothetical protein PGTUg99_014223 [Puccinia graminis f. sp. tritici]
MAKLSDLPPELVHRIIDHIVPPLPSQLVNENQYAHRELDHNGIRGIQPRPRPHVLESKGNNGTAREFTINTPVDRINHNAPDVPEVSWPEALPTNPILPLALVNHTFRRCAQETLFKDVALSSQWQAHLFHQALIYPATEDTSGHINPTIDADSSRSSGISPTRQGQLATQVRSLRVKWSGYCSMGIGGGALLCEIIRSCPFLENFAISTAFLIKRCREPILDALASRRYIKDFVVIQDHRLGRTTLQWLADELVDELFTKWEFLETVELVRLHSREAEITSDIDKPIPVLNCALRTLILSDFDLHERELSMLLKSCQKTLRTLQIRGPGRRLDRPGLCQVLKECTSPDLESLTIELDDLWHLFYLRSKNDSSDNPDTNRGLLDIVFKSSALNKLKSLSLTGVLTGSEFFNLLPQSIVKLTWARSGTPAAPFLKALSSWRENENLTDPCGLPGPQFDSAAGGSGRVPWLPNLKCCSVQVGQNWRRQDRQAVRDALEARGVCFHMVHTPGFDTWDEHWDRQNLQEAGQMVEDTEDEDGSPGEGDNRPLGVGLGQAEEEDGLDEDDGTLGGGTDDVFDDD